VLVVGKIGNDKDRQISMGSMLKQTQKYGYEYIEYRENAGVEFILKYIVDTTADKEETNNLIKTNVCAEFEKRHLDVLEYLSIKFDPVFEYE